jgi:hypothetical protein
MNMDTSEEFDIDITIRVTRNKWGVVKVYTPDEVVEIDIDARTGRYYANYMTVSGGFRYSSSFDSSAEALAEVLENFNI